MDRQLQALDRRLAGYTGVVGIRGDGYTVLYVVTGVATWAESVETVATE
jgi:hypothetical protein